MRTTRKRGVTSVALGAALVLALSSCGGSSSPPAKASAARSSSPTASPTKAAAGAISDAQLAASLCQVIRSVQGKLGDDAVPAAYLAQFTGGIAGVLDDQDSIALFRAKGDALAKKQCPTEYQKFLKQAQISSLSAA